MPSSASPHRWRADIAALAVLGGCAGLAALIGTGLVDPGRSVSFVASVLCVLAVLIASGLIAYRNSNRSLTRVFVSPLSIAAATWLLLFVVRPIELYLAPEQAAVSLAQFGFHLGDLTRTVAFGALGCAGWSIGYLVALGRFQPTSSTARPTARMFAVSAVGAVVVVVAGTFLWLLLFFRQGGVGALVESAASIRINQLASFYGFVGVWLVQGAALVAFVAVLRGARHARWVLAATLPLVFLSAIALQLRLLAALWVVSAIAAYVSLRRVRARQAFAMASIICIGVACLAVFQQVREYSIFVPTSEALRLTARTPVAAFLVSDLGTYDNFVAMQKLVPESIPYLDGRTLLEIPQAFVPRSIWPEKPLGIDFRVSSYLYPGVFVAVPISLQGELFWNGGALAIALGSTVIGVLLGLVARIGLRAAPGSPLFILYIVAFPFTHAFLTRGLATMTQNFAFAMTGVLIAIAAIARPSFDLSRLSEPWTLRRLRRPVPDPRARRAAQDVS